MILFEFIGSQPFIRQLRSDKGWRIEIDIDQSQYDKIKDLPNYQEELLKVIIQKYDS